MFWKKKGAVPPPESDTVRQARERFEAGQGQEALGLLKGAFHENPSDVAALSLGANILATLGGTEQQVLFEAAAHHPDSAQIMFNLGYHFVGVGMDDLAVPFLTRAHALEKHPLVAQELSLALLSVFRADEAARVLEEVPPPLSFWATFQHAWARLLTAQTTPARELLTQVPEVPADEYGSAQYALKKLRSTLQRLELVGTPQPFIRDWQFIQYGSVILDFMDDRVTEGGLEVAGGRYVYQSGGHEEVHGILQKLVQLLQALDISPPVVWACGDQDSQIIGLSLAELLGLPLVQDLDLSQPALIVAGDSQNLVQSDAAMEALRRVQSSQVVFAFNVNWVSTGGITPDIAGLLSQHYVFPWGRSLRLNPDTGEVEQTPPDERPASVIAAELLATTPTADPSFADNLTFYLRHRTGLTLGQPGAERQPFRRDSPVPGSYFG